MSKSAYNLFMKSNIYISLQKKYGGMWVATNKTGEKVYASSKKAQELFSLLKNKKISKQKTSIGYVEKYGRVYLHISISI